MRVKPKKSLGQHFLANDGIAQRIAEALVFAEQAGTHEVVPEAPLVCELSKKTHGVGAETSSVCNLSMTAHDPGPKASPACESDKPAHGVSGKTQVLEVGCGTGALTKHLLRRGDILLKGIEIDGESIAYLRENLPEIMPRLYEADFLKADLRKIFPEGDFCVIGNFPYNISSQIFFKILDYKDDIPQVVGMLQKEVAERLASGPGNKSYGILSVLLQAWYDIEYLFTVGEHEFIPPPKVKSAVIRLQRNRRTELGCDETKFKQVVKAAFNQRRKTLRNSLKPLGIEPPEQFAGLRPEQLGVEDFISLTKGI